MKLSPAKIDVFSWMAVLVILVTIGIFINSYLNMNFPVFTTEEEIEEAIEREFPTFAEYL